VFHTKKPPHKQHIWFLPTHKPTLKKPKELFLAFALEKHNEKIVNKNIKTDRPKQQTLLTCTVK